MFINFCSVPSRKNIGFQTAIISVKNDNGIRHIVLSLQKISAVKPGIGYFEITI